MEVGYGGMAEVRWLLFSLDEPSIDEDLRAPRLGLAATSAESLSHHWLLLTPGGYSFEES